MNDSLRATVLGLVALQARGVPSEVEEAEPDSTADSGPEAIIGAGASRARNWGLRIFFSLVFLGLAGLVIRLIGTNEKEGRALLEKAGLRAFEAVQVVVRPAKPLSGLVAKTRVKTPGGLSAEDVKILRVHYHFVDHPTDRTGVRESVRTGPLPAAEARSAGFQ